MKKRRFNVDRNKFSAIAHHNHAFANPISEEKLRKMVGMVSLKPNEQVIDIGSGKCELLIRLVENFKVRGTAIELYDGAIEEAKKRASRRIPEGSIEFIINDAAAAVEKCEKGRF